MPETVTIQQTFQSAIQHHQAARLAEAEALYRQILVQNPRHADALQMLGVIALQTRNSKQAIPLLEQSLALKPDSALAYSNLGMALASEGRRDEAIAQFQKALSLRADLFEAWENLGTVLRETKRFGEAAAALGKATELRPANADLFNKLGTVLMEDRRVDEAMRAFQEALRLRPNFAEALNNLGLALQQTGKLDAAIDSFQQAIALKPTSAELYNNLATALLNNRWTDEAMAILRQALALSPSYAEAHYNLGNALLEKEEPDEAAAEFRQALSARPDYVEALHNLGNALKARDHFDEAIACFRRVIELGFNSFEVYGNLGTALRTVGELDEAIACFRRAVELKPCCGAAENLLYSIHFHPDFDARQIYEEHRRWNQACAQPLAAMIPPHTNDRSLDRKLRIGYVSPDFRRHPVGGFMVPLLANHDPAGFDIFCYCDVRHPDPLTEALRAHAGVWRDVVNLTDEVLCDLIRQDEIDILVDLAMHTDHSRMLLFARKPAPVQATYLAYCGTTGLTTIDYRLTDPYLDPPGTDESVYSEKSIRLPMTYWCYQPQPEAPSVAPLPAIGAQVVTFGCLNNFAKVTPPALAAWRQLMLAIPNSRLILHNVEGSHHQKLRNQFAADGIDPQRLQFVGFLPLIEYFEQYHQIDVALDTFPYNGGTTTCDALWMGVPVVTVAGRTAVSRGGKSILSNVGMRELIAQSAEQYVQIATQLAADLPRLAEWRAGLRQRMSNSPLMNPRQFARDVEAAYREMWEHWRLAALPHAP